MTTLKPTTRLLLVAALSLAGSAPAFGAPLVWQGDDGTNPTLWSVGENWDTNSVPLAGDDLTFGTATSYTVNLGGVNRDVKTLTFNAASDYVFNGDTLRSTARNIDFLTQSGAGKVTINSAFTWTSQNNNRYIVGAGTGAVTLAGSISGDMGLEMRSSTFTLFITGDNNGWTGSNAALNPGSNSVTLGHVNALGSAKLSMGGGTGTGNGNKINASTSIVSNGVLAISGGSSGQDVKFTGGNFSFASGTMDPRGNKIAVADGLTLTVRGAFDSSDELVVNGASTSKVVLAGNVSVLSGTNTDGIIRVQGGTLLINGTQTVTKAATNANYAVGTGATLGGNGTLQSGGLASITGTIAPGTSVGTLTFGTNASTGDATDVQFLNTSKLAVELSSAGVSDLLAIAGDLTIDNGAILDLDLLNLETLSGDYTLATFASLAGTFSVVKYEGATIVNPIAAGAIGGTHQLVYGTNAISLTAIPEPASLAILALGGLMMLPRRKQTR